MTVAVRAVELSDASAVARLFGLLGLPLGTGRRPAELAATDDRREAVFVGCLADTVVGVVCVAAVRFVNEAALRARITAIVIDEGARGSGIGAKLLRRAEAWARDARH